MGADEHIQLVPATEQHLDYIRTLLSEYGLPTQDIAEQKDSLYIFTADSARVGVGGLERYGDAALLRSIAVEPAKRGNGFGRTLCQQLFARATADDVTRVYLLTTTAEAFFEDLGFHEIQRDDVPPQIRQTGEFQEFCPSTATCMTKQLE
ncbi:amino-acid N-acetyltransferase [Haladaptatus litoreus]|uniref:Amino-acid N-acetyltransferase n=1 Tax=Haladaptatus litoreus TaxID=553468 RepID=A0A1N7CMJ1_9EURY|nr:arsenic resistance N-acetyltransferase ArsN2 [Haladaptatus litoreus]SIR64821.1 amino-acid N-acetyltransferase [Haladaptatus litoreus]